MATVTQLVSEVLDCGHVDKKIDALGVSKLGYIGTHVQVMLRGGEFTGLEAELQIATMTQRLWADLTHDTIYKHDGNPAALSVEFSRRVHLMAGLLEVADAEFVRLDRELPRDNARELYRLLERFHFTLVADRPDAAFSTEVIRWLLPLYGDVPIVAIGRQLEDFFDSHKATVATVYADPQRASSSPIMRQPELFLVYERLEADADALVATWINFLPFAEIERLANSLGISLD